MSMPCDDEAVVLICGSISSIPTIGFNMKKVQKGHVTLKWSVAHTADVLVCPIYQADVRTAGILGVNRAFVRCGSDTAEASTQLCKG